MANGPEIATAYLSLVPTLKGAGKKIGQELDGSDVRQAADRAGKNAGSRMGRGLRTAIGVALAGVSVGAIASFATDAVASFSELEDSTAAAGVVFGKNMGGIVKQSKTASSELGLSQQQVISAANTFGTYGKAAGLSGKELASFATEQTALAADMASFKGTSPEQAIEAIGAALRGEMEPIRTYGVLLDDNTLRQEAFKMGLIKTTKQALTPQQKTLAAQAAIWKQTRDAQGDFARTSQSTANIAKTLTANTEDLKAKIGAQLAPAFTSARMAANDLLAQFSGLIDQWSAGEGAAGRLRSVLGALGAVLANVGRWLSDHRVLVFSILGAWAAIRAGIAIWRGVQAAIALVRAVQLGYVAATYGAAGANLVAGNSAKIYTAVTKAQMIATHLATAATKVWSVTTKVAAVVARGMGVALRFMMGPIGLVITAIGLLVAGLVYFFTKTTVGKKVVTVAWAAIQAAVAGVVKWWTNTAAPAIGQFFSGISEAAGDVVGWIKKNWPLLVAIITGPIGLATLFVIKNWGQIKTATVKVWRDVSGAIVTAWNNTWLFLKKAWGWIDTKVFLPFRLGVALLRAAFKLGKEKITGSWAGIWTGLKEKWSWIDARVFAPFKLGLLVLRAAFRLGREKVKGHFSAMGAGLRATWDFVRDKVFGKFRGGLRALRDAFRATKDGIKTIWDKIKAIAARPVNFMIETVYNNGLRSLVGKVFKFLDKKNPLPEANPVKFDKGGWTGPGGKLTPAGIVHADEFVINKAARRRIEARTPGVLDYMNRSGRLPGYAGGGSVAKLSKAAKWWQELGARVSEFGAWGQPVGQHMAGSLHYSGRAADLNYGPGGENATEKAFFDRNMGRFRSMFPDLGVLWRTTGHFNHAHIDTGGTSAVGGGGLGGFNPLSMVGDFRALLGKMKDGLADNPYGAMLLGVGRQLVNGPIGWLKDRFGNIAEGAGELAGKVVGAVRNAGAQATVRALAMTYGSGFSRWGVGKQWDALNWLINTESSWNPNAANPTSSARGLFQKMTSVHGPVEPSVFGQAKWGLDYITGRYGDPLSAMRFHQSHGFYAGGGRVYDQGGWLPSGGVGVNLTGRPEAVLNPTESAALKAGLNRSAPMVGTMVVANPREAIYELEAMKRRATVRAGLAGVR